MRTVAVPAQRNADDPEVIAGLAAFRRFGCDGCHVPTLATDDGAALPELRNQTFHPFTDLLLHDMGEGLADGRPDHDASGSEWRTPPLWGLGLVPVGQRPRPPAPRRPRPRLRRGDPVAWRRGRGGEARPSAPPTSDERDALVAFLASL